jgi:hypothetical protein
VDRLLQKEDGNNSTLVYHGAVATPRAEPTFAGGQAQAPLRSALAGGSGEGRPPASAPPPASSSIDGQPKRPSGFFQSLWEAIAAPPLQPQPQTKPTAPAKPAPAALQMESSTRRDAPGRIVAPSTRQVPDVQTAGGAEIVRYASHET